MIHCSLLAAVETGRWVCRDRLGYWQLLCHILPGMTTATISIRTATREWYTTKWCRSDLLPPLNEGGRGYRDYISIDPGMMGWVTDKSHTCLPSQLATSCAHLASAR